MAVGCLCSVAPASPGLVRSALATGQDIPGFDSGAAAQQLSPSYPAGYYDSDLNKSVTLLDLLEQPWSCPFLPLPPAPVSPSPGLPLASKGFPEGSSGKESACDAGDTGSILGLGRSPGGGNGNPLQYSCLENPMDRGA